MTDSLFLRSPQPHVALLQYQKAAHFRFEVRADQGRKQRAKMVTFLHILLQYLQVAEASKVQDVKRIIHDSVRRNRNGESDTSPLQAYVLRRIEHYIGPKHWELGSRLFREFMETKKVQHKQRRMQQWRLPLETRNTSSIVTSVENKLSIPI